MSTPVNGWRSRWAGPPGAIRGTDTGRFLRETRRADPGTRRSDEQHGTASSASRRGGRGDALRRAEVAISGRDRIALASPGG